MNWKHGFAGKNNGLPEYDVWNMMKMRCYNPNNKRYKNYGARGIKVCDRWKNDFEVFISDIGRRPSDLHSLERRNNNGDYEPQNCFWATNKEQCNNKTDNVFIVHNNERKTLRQWADFYQVKYKPFWKFIRKENMGIDDAVNKCVDLARGDIVTYKGESLNLTQWAKRFNSYRQIFYIDKYASMTREEIIEMLHNKNS